MSGNPMPLFKKRVKKKPAVGADDSTQQKSKPAALCVSSQQTMCSFTNILAPDASPQALDRLKPPATHGNVKGLGTSTWQHPVEVSSEAVQSFFPLHRASSRCSVVPRCGCITAVLLFDWPKQSSAGEPPGSCGAVLKG